MSLYQIIAGVAGAVSLIATFVGGWADRKDSEKMFDEKIKEMESKFKK